MAQGFLMRHMSIKKKSISLTHGIYIHASFTKILETLRLLTSKPVSTVWALLPSLRHPPMLSLLLDNAAGMSHKHLKSCMSKVQFIFAIPLSPPMFPISMNSTDMVRVQTGDGTHIVVEQEMINISNY